MQAQRILLGPQDPKLGIFASHSFSVTYCSFLQHIRIVKIILCSKALPKQATGCSWPWFAILYHSCPAVAMGVE